MHRSGRQGIRTSNWKDKIIKRLIIINQLGFMRDGKMNMLPIPRATFYRNIMKQIAFIFLTIIFFTNTAFAQNPTLKQTGKQTPFILGVVDKIQPVALALQITCTSMKRCMKCALCHLMVLKNC
jgi:hypothetical protein